MSIPTLEEIAAGKVKRPDTSDEATSVRMQECIVVLGREIDALRRTLNEKHAEDTRMDDKVYARLAALESARTATTARLDSHNRVMESIVRRVRALEQQARPEQEDGHLAVDAWRERANDALDTLRTANDNCERLEAERDAALAKVERMREAICRLTSGGKLHPKACTKSMRDPLGLSDDHFDCTCGLTADLEDA